MHIELLVEEPSAEAALDRLLPVVAPSCTFKIHPHNRKKHLLDSLPGRLRGYGHILRDQPDWRVVVLIDEDREDCRQLKKRIVEFARKAGIRTSVLARVAVEELEAWFLGDVPALVNSYPGVPRTLGQRRRFRDPDAVPGGTWESLERVLGEAGYYAAVGLPKIEVARTIASSMNVEENRSRSFRVFRDGIRRMVGNG